MQSHGHCHGLGGYPYDRLSRDGYLEIGNAILVYLLLGTP